MSDDIYRRLADLERRLDRWEAWQADTLVLLDAPLTSTSWDGDAYSTAGATLIDLSVVFGVPARVKGILARVAIRDSGSAANDCYFALSPNTTYAGMIVRCSGVANDQYTNGCLVVKCDANGDVYYQAGASGAGTLDVAIQIWGYWR